MYIKKMNKSGAGQQQLHQQYHPRQVMLWKLLWRLTRLMDELCSLPLMAPPGT